MQFLKKHFEKIILSVVLALLGGAAVWLSLAVKEAEVEMQKGFGSPPRAKPWTNVDTAPYRNALQQLTNPPELSLTGEHNLFNSGVWKKLPDGTLVKVTKSGVNALSVTDIRPLYFWITLDNQAGDGFYLTAKHDYGPAAVHWYGRLGDKAEPRKPFPIVGTNRAPDKPSEIVLQIEIPATADKESETVSASMREPYKRLEGYEVDMKYSASDVTNAITRKHLEDTFRLSQDTFRIIAITSNAVTVQETRTSQKTEKKWNANPDAAAAPEGRTGQMAEQAAGAESRPR